MPGGPVAVVLAGGRASRMGGGDKALRPLARRTLLDHVIAAVRPQVRALVLSANGDPARFARWQIPVLADALPGFPGPLAGVLAGMHWAAAHHPDMPDLLSVPSDTPFLPADLVARLAAARGGMPVVCAASAGRVHPVVALWPVALAEALERALRAGERRLGPWAAAQGLAMAEFATLPRDPFFNVNRPEDSAAAEGLARPRA